MVLPQDQAQANEAQAILDEYSFQMYLDAEPELTLSDFKSVEKNIKKLSEKNTHLEEKFNDLLSYLRTNSIEVPNF